MNNDNFHNDAGSRGKGFLQYIENWRFKRRGKGNRSFEELACKNMSVKA